MIWDTTYVDLAKTRATHIGFARAPLGELIDSKAQKVVYPTQVVVASCF